MTLNEKRLWPGLGELLANLEWIRTLKSISKLNGGLESWPPSGLNEGADDSDLNKPVRKKPVHFSCQTEASCDETSPLFNRLGSSRRVLKSSAACRIDLLVTKRFPLV